MYIKLLFYLYIIQITLKQNIMKTKRFTTSEIATYRLSNSAKKVSFDTIEEAKQHVEKERELHPRSKKFNPNVFDTFEKKSYRF